MSDTRPAPEGKRRPRTRWVYVLLLLVVVLGILGRTYLNPAFYIPGLEAALEEATGLSASVAGISVVPGETTVLTLSGIVLGDANFGATVDRLNIEVLSRPLLNRRIRIPEIASNTVEVRLPVDDGDALDRMSELIDSLSEQESSFPWDVDITYIRVKEGRVLQGEEVASFDLQADRIFGNRASALLNATVSRFGDDATVAADLVWSLGVDGQRHVRGWAKGSDLDVAGLDIPDLPAARVNAELVIDDSTAKTMAARLTGVIDAESEPALDGTFSAALSVAEDILAVDDIRWDAPGVKLAAEAKRFADGGVTFTAKELSISDRALDDLVALGDGPGYVLSATDEARLSGTNVSIALDAGDGAEPRVTRGRVMFDGLHVALESGESVARDLRGDLEVRDNVVFVRELRDENIDLTGRLTPDVERETLALDLQGTVLLSREHLAFLGGGEEIQDISGRLDLERITGTFGERNGVPEDLVIAGTLRDGELTFAPEWELPPLDGLEAEFTTDTRAIRTSLVGSTPKSGVARAAGEYTFDDHAWTGEATFDVHAWVTPFIEADAVRHRYGPVLAEYGSPTFQVRAQLPWADSDAIALDVTLEGTPGLDGSVEAHRSASGEWRLGNVVATAQVPLDDMDYVVFADVTGNGVASLGFSRDAARGHFDVRANLKACTLMAGEYIEKRTGDAFTLEINGDADESWSLNTLDIDCLGVPVACTFEDGALRIPQTTVGLSHWVRLLPDDATATGYLTGAFDGAENTWTLSVQEAGISVNPELGIDSATGDVSILDGKVIINDLHVLGAQSDFVLSAGMEDKGWAGSLRGAKFDVNAFQEFQKAYRSFRYPDVDGMESQGGLPEEAGPADRYWDKPFVGTFDVALDTLYLGRGSVSNVRANVQAEPDAIRFANLRMQPDAGIATGEASVLPGPAGENLLALNLTLDDFNARVLDDMFYEKPRGLSGGVSGQIEFKAPLGEIRSMMAAGKGRASLTATNGSLGKMGFASKLLTALKTVNVINLRAPSLRDKGLTYRTLGGRAVMRDGVLHIQDVLLEETSYAMEIGGTLDYAQDATDLLVFVRVLEGVTNLAQRIPGLRQVAEVTTKQVGVNVAFSGSPWDMQSNVVASTGIVESSGEALKNVGDATKKAVKKILKSNP